MKENTIKRPLFIISILCGLITSSVFAGTLTANNKATATLSSSCTVQSDNLVFGTINPTSDTFATGNITTLCTKGTAYKIGISLGNGGTGTSTMKYAYSGYVRYMNGSVDKLAYNIFRDSGYTQIFGGNNAWGGGQGYPVEVNLVGTGATQITPMYGALSSQFITPGNYQETTSVTVDF